MAGNKSAIKRHKQSEVRRIRNKSRKSEVKTTVKKLLEAVAKGDKDKAEKLLVVSQKLIDTAAQKGMYHKNTSARKKSRLSRMVNKMGAAKQA